MTCVSLGVVGDQVENSSKCAIVCGVPPRSPIPKEWSCPSPASTTPSSTSATSPAPASSTSRCSAFATLIWMPGQAAFFQAPGSTNDHDLGTFQIGSGAGPSARRALDRRPLPPGLGGRHACRARPAPTAAGRARSAGRSDRPRHHQGALRPGPRRHRVRGLLAGAGRVRSTDELTRRLEANPRPRPLDLDAEIARYGAETRGGVGISIAV